MDEEHFILTSPDLLPDLLCPHNGPTLSPLSPAAFGAEENPLPLFGESPTVSSQKKLLPEENETPLPKKRRCPEENETSKLHNEQKISLDA